ncbi:rna polymerase sigma factor : RNA polymerase sigma-70 factor, Rhodopirellula/Verrucomicrobium family OS=Singulisphaera acidiphila (strain ATCC BAA-1392 / DSM 18658 / VKM B-2454 / MOB10) GN=Sinac_7577 PE=4 SV=1: Sigma70_r2 [Gemmataceae bacterium]|nr:rna polymerase sigma factor : RNA polymerase sigma-70 factor, Rhodopirellula/Verrucomicrobium family OS=Singulisphaera acidiphila (strain ATCC BAA-1392 / DSM 18658 / VKM B-2454 / MOB10) GN=Sinac_7577 PE=4 SV=1: Sigma70_r2 [Gemmataceae bacterium]VTU00862.1 rna polymerase sigma factor : RNA polymerase sigma-70 factor, Rhodopirellula/Verrucomicrobium family OS=Singulisphaera acidiphila (strain ATCC BAA-1392 / DSM 18658 / VKM B-2454 / MOB10) GN=Sinac_7577 PE=4 SV=1: Sigma70_r2 [Gemmataceae bacteriu
MTTADAITIQGRTPAGTGADKGRSFLALHVAHQRRVYAYILALLPRRADADDVAQDTWLTMWAKFDPLAQPSDFVGWACTIAKYKVLERRRKAGRCRVLFSQEAFETIAAAAADRVAAEDTDEWQDALAGCLGKLPPGLRDLLAWRVEPGATTQSVAAKAGRSTEAVYKALAKARRALAECVNRALAGVPR